MPEARDPSCRGEGPFRAMVELAFLTKTSVAFFVDVLRASGASSPRPMSARESRQLEPLPSKARGHGILHHPSWVFEEPWFVESLEQDLP